MNKIDVIIFGKSMHLEGGVQKYIFSLLSHINYNKIKMIVVAPKSPDKKQYHLEKLNAQLEVLYISNSKESVFNHFWESFILLKKYNNHILHIHVTSSKQAVIGMIARLSGIKKIIYHSHNASFVQTNRIKLSRLFFKLTGSFFLGCSIDAGRYMFGDSVVNSNKFMIAKNGIDTNKFKFDNRKRLDIRKQYEIGHNIFLLGFVGRLSSSKNISFLIELLFELDKINEKYILMIVGDGSERVNLENLAKRLKIERKVFFVGTQMDVEGFMAAFDCLLLPSLYEALGSVLIEAQASGLRCIASQNVSRESEITDLIVYEELKLDYWINRILTLPKTKERNIFYKKVQSVGYDLKESSIEIEDIYNYVLPVGK